MLNCLKKLVLSFEVYVRRNVRWTDFTTYILCIKFNFSFYYFAWPHKLQNFNCARIKAICLSVCISPSPNPTFLKRYILQGTWGITLSTFTHTFNHFYFFLFFRYPKGLVIIRFRWLKNFQLHTKWNESKHLVLNAPPTKADPAGVSHLETCAETLGKYLNMHKCSQVGGAREYSSNSLP